MEVVMIVLLSVVVLFWFTGTFANLMVEKMKKEEDRVGYIEGLIVYKE